MLAEIFLGPFRDFKFLFVGTVYPNLWGRYDLREISEKR